jgi:hypothetical protein
MAKPYRYAAFISYSSADAAFARKLHRALEAYRIPAAMGEIRLTDHPSAKNRIYPCFRDREELPSGDLGRALNKALDEAGALIVVCSPHAAQSEWVEKEIRHFETLGRSDRIFAVIADGEPLASEAGDADNECFPPALRHAARVRAGEAAPPEVVAGDARRDKDGFRNAWLKQVAGLTGVNLGKLLDRDRAARRARAVRIAAGVCALLLGVLTLAAVNDARLQRLDLVAQARQLNGVEGRTLDAHAFAIAALGRASLYAPGAALAKAAAADAGLQARLAADLRDHTELVEVAANGAWVQAYNGEDFRLWSLADGRSSPLSARALFVEQGRAIVHRDPSGYVVRDLTTNAATTLAFHRLPETREKDLVTSGPFVAAYEWGGDSALWDLRSNARVPLDATEGIAFTPGGTALLLHSAESGAAIRILASGRTVPLSREYALPPAHQRNGLSPGDLRYILDASSQNTRAALIDLSDGSRREFTWPAGAHAGRFSDDGEYASLHYADYSEGVLDVATGQIRHFADGDHILADRNGRVFAPGGHVIVAFLARDNRRHVLDVSNGADVAISDDFDEFVFSPNGRYAFGRNTSEEGQLLDLSTGRISALGRVGEGSHYEFIPQGALLLSGPLAEAEGTIIRPFSHIDPSTTTIRPLADIDQRHQFYVSPTGRYVTIVRQDGVRAIIDLVDFSEHRFGRAPTHAYGGAPLFAEVHNVVAMPGADGVWAVWDLETPRREGSSGAWARTICAESANVVRPFIAADRTSAALRGRPWQACAWRGLLSLDGWAQALRYWAVRMGARWDYAPDECTRAVRGFGCPRGNA